MKRITEESVLHHACRTSLERRKSHKLSYRIFTEEPDSNGQLTSKKRRDKR